MKKTDMKFNSRKGSAIPYMLLSIVLALIVLVFMNI